MKKRKPQTKAPKAKPLSEFHLRMIKQEMHNYDQCSPERRRDLRAYDDPYYKEL